ncbi:uncharacterized protein LOC106470943 [Limulus polyphemus]|uniref:Uncharacterized protein LOC106470943 n=1 Tax=Limulus polyphemus TaxID=6850 RepID=A0ABM1THD6_LIMPO|nr:uncharacterized protein LOC106470943 [Limulus polyphemus]
MTRTDQQTCENEEKKEDDISGELKGPATSESKETSPMPKETNTTSSAPIPKENPNEIIQPLDKPQTMPTVTSTTVTIETRETLKKVPQPIISSTTNRISLKGDASKEEPYLKTSSTTNEISFIKQDAMKEVTQPTTSPTTKEMSFVKKNVSQPMISPTTTETSSIKQEAPKEVSQPMISPITTKTSFVKQEAPKEVPQPTVSPTTTETCFVKQEASKEALKLTTSPTTTETSLVKQEAPKEVSQPMISPITTKTSFVKQEDPKEGPQPTVSPTTTETCFVKQEAPKEGPQPTVSPTTTETSFVKQEASKEALKLTTSPTTTETSLVKQEASKEVSQPMISPTTIETSSVKQEASKEGPRPTVSPTTTETCFVKQEASVEALKLTTSPTTTETSLVKQEAPKEVSQPMISPITTKTSFVKQESPKEGPQPTVSPTTIETGFVKQEAPKEGPQPTVSPTTTETCLVKQEAPKEGPQPTVSPTTTETCLVKQEAPKKGPQSTTYPTTTDISATHTTIEENAAVKIQSAFRGFMTRKHYAATLAEDGYLIYPQMKRDNENTTEYELQKITRTSTEENVQESEENNFVDQKECVDEELNLEKANEEEPSTEKCQQIGFEGNIKKNPEQAEYDNQLKIEADKKEFYQPEEKKEAAATRIQAVFRGYQVRREIKHDNLHIKSESTKEGEEQGENGSYSQLQNEAKTINQTSVGDENEKGYLELQQHKDLQEEGEHRKNPQEPLISLENKNSECLKKENIDVDHGSVAGLFRAEPIRILNFDDSFRLIYPKDGDNKGEISQKRQEQSSFSVDNRRRSAPVFGTPKFEENINFQAYSQKTQEKAEIPFTFQEECTLLEDHCTMSSQKEISKAPIILDTQEEEADVSLSDGSTFKQRLNQPQVIDVRTSDQQSCVEPFNITDVSHSDVLLQNPEDLLMFQKTQTSCAEPSQESLFQGNTSSFISEKSSENDFLTFDEEVAAPKDSWILDEKKDSAFLKIPADLINLLDDSLDVQSKPETQRLTKKPEESMGLFFEDCLDSSCTTQSDESNPMLNTNVTKDLNFLEIPKPTINSNSQQEDTLIQLEETNMKGISYSRKDTFWPSAYETDKKELRTSAQVIGDRSTLLYCQNTLNNSDILKDVQQFTGEIEISDGIKKDELDSLKFQIQNEDTLIERPQIESVPETTLVTKTNSEQITESSVVAESTSEHLREDTLVPEPPGTSLQKDTLVPELPDTSLQKDTLVPEPPGTSVQKDTLVPKLPGTSLQKDTLVPELPDTSLQKDTLVPELPGTSLQKDTLVPKLPGTSLQKDTLVPELPDTSLQKDTLVPELPDTSLQKDTLVPELPGTYLQKDTLVPEPPGTSVQKDTLVPEPPGTSLQKDNPESKKFDQPTILAISHCDQQYPEQSNIVAKAIVSEELKLESGVESWVKK